MTKDRTKQQLLMVECLKDVIARIEAGANIDALLISGLEGEQTYMTFVTAKSLPASAIGRMLEDVVGELDGMIEVGMPPLIDAEVEGMVMQ